MLRASQLIIEILVDLVFLVAAVTCLLWPGMFYEHARRAVYRNTDIVDKRIQNLQRRGYIWTVRIIGVIAALMFTFIVIHLF
jgi:hypothetical protein